MNEAEFVRATFTNPPPAYPTITSPTAGQVFELAAEESIEVSFADGDLTVVGFSCRLDVGSMTSCASGWKTPALSAGKHTVTVSAMDGGGNISKKKADRGAGEAARQAVARLGPDPPPARPPRQASPW